MAGTRQTDLGCTRVRFGNCDILFAVIRGRGEAVGLF